MNIREILQRITATRYTRALEAEVLRLRAENRALLNSILGIAGVPPITVPDSVAIGNSPAAVFGRPSRIQGEASPKKQSPGARSANVKTQGPNAVAPMRRRSWHQIYRMLEIDSASKKPGDPGGQLSADGLSGEATTPHPRL
jgi:hypothetical protein